jgi:hypothetical protein
MDGREGERGRRRMELFGRKSHSAGGSEVGLDDSITQFIVSAGSKSSCSSRHHIAEVGSV